MASESTELDRSEGGANAAATKIVIKMPEGFFPHERFVEAYPDATIVYDLSPGLGEHVEDVNIVIAADGLTADVVKSAPKLEYIQTISAGIERVTNGLAGWKGTMASGKGVSVSQLAEHALAMMLSFARGLPELHRRQTAHKWLPGNGPMLPKLFELDGQRLVLIGYGEIGREIAKRAKAFNMEVWAVRRNAATASDEYADRILPTEQMDEAIGAADHLLLILPMLPETAEFFDASKFALMKESAYFYNMGRGGLVQQADLIAALSDGRIAGAGLDCVTPEPLNEDSPIWDFENVVMTAHTAGNTPRFLERMTEHLASNLERWRKHEPLKSLIDVDRGY